MSLEDQLAELDEVLRERHAETYDALQPGLSLPGKPGAIDRWFGWRNGEPMEHDGDRWFLDMYRFVSKEEGVGRARQARRLVLVHPLQAAALAVFARRMFYSWPLVIDAAGDGYYYHTRRRTVFYTFEGERDILLRSVSDFIEIVTRLAASGLHDVRSVVEFEYELLQQHAA